MSDSSDDDMPLAQAPKLNGASNGTNGVHNQNGKRPLPESSDLSSDDAPLTKRVKKEPESSPARPQPTRKRSKRAVKAEESDDDDKPLHSKATKVPMKGAYEAATSAKPRRSAVKSYKEESDEEMKNITLPQPDEEPAADSDSSSDAPLSKTPKKPNGNAQAKRPAKRKKADSDEDAVESSEDEKPVAKRRASTAKAKPTPKKRVKKAVKEEDDSSDDEALAKPKKVAVKKESKEPKEKKPKKVKNEQEEQNVYKWWDEQVPDDIEGDGTKKWDTLRHNGVLFPPPYEPLPSNIKLIYNGEPVDLPPESEEVAGFFAGMLDTDHAQNKVFQGNFFADWLDVLKKHPPRNKVKITKFELCDFRPMADYIEADRQKVRNRTKAEKQAAKEVKDKLEAPYATCYLNNRPEKVGNFRVEPPGLFRGRGDHPRKGCLKKRVGPEDIILNIGEEETVPVPNVPGTWKKVIHDNTVTWLANWKENVNGNFKYVFLAANSSLKGKSDRDKFEKARELKSHIDRIRADYEEDLKSKQMGDRQRATAMYLIDKYALRAGNEKGDDEADTVGCCSLRCEHITLDKSGRVTLDFLGKDSIRFYKEIDDIHPQVFKNLRMFKGSKKDGDLLFDRVTTSGLNAHLRSYMKGLTAKVFRTYNASTLFEKKLLAADFSKGALEQEKINLYNEANKAAAELCNHQRAPPKTFEKGLEKMDLKVQYLKHQRMTYRRALLVENPKLKKSRPELVEPESDLEDEDKIIEFEDRYYKEKIDELEAAWAKAKKTFEDTKVSPNDEEYQKRQEKYEENIRKTKEEYEHWLSNRGRKGWEFSKGNWDEDKLLKALDKSDEMIGKHKLKKEDKESMKTISLTTSKINYLDPRITSAFAKRWNADITRLFSKTLRNKFPWAMDTEAEWRF